MKSERNARVNRLLRTTLAELVPGALKDPAVRTVELVSVTAVKVSGDLRYATVFVSVAGNPEQKQLVRRGLERARGFLRGELGRRVRLRHIPELAFELDETVASAARIEEILREIGKEAEVAQPLASGSPQEVAQIIGGARSTLITCHPNPDGDAIGSMLAACWALREMGQQVTAYNPDPVPQTFAFLAGADEIVRSLDSALQFDLTLVLDCSDARMFPAGPPPRERLGQVVVIDHHRTLSDFGDVIYHDEQAASVGVLLFRLFEEMGLSLSVRVAEALYCSVLSDTGSFRYQNTNPEALRVAAALLERGVDPWHVASNLYETRPREQLQLLTEVLQTLRVSPEGLAAALTVSEEMLTRTGCTPDMVDGFVNYARSLRGVEVAILMRPRRDAVRVSMRSRGAFDVSEVALRFGGGGHRNAAGCTVETTDAEALLEQLFADVERMAGKSC